MLHPLVSSLSSLYCCPFFSAQVNRLAVKAQEKAGVKAREMHMHIRGCGCSSVSCREAYLWSNFDSAFFLSCGSLFLSFSLSLLLLSHSYTLHQELTFVAWISKWECRSFPLSLFIFMSLALFSYSEGWKSVARHTSHATVQLFKSSSSVGSIAHVFQSIGCMFAVLVDPFLHPFAVWPSCWLHGDYFVRHSIHSLLCALSYYECTHL